MWMKTFLCGARIVFATACSGSKKARCCPLNKKGAASSGRSCNGWRHSAHSGGRAILGSLALILQLLAPTSRVIALPPEEPGDGVPRDPCLKVNTVSVLPSLELRGLPLSGCSVEIAAGGSKIEWVKNLCFDPIYYDLPSNVPVTWQLVSWPGNPAPDFSHTSTLASLSLPRVGTYVVRFTVCPSGNCSFRPTPGGTNYPIGTTSLDFPIVAVGSIPIPIEKYPVLPPSVRASTAMTIDIKDLDCRCGGSGDPWYQQWVTVEPWSGVDNYKSLEGYVEKSWVAVADDLLNHDSNDVGFEVLPDPPFRSLSNGNKAHMDVEWETGAFPERFRPISGDRISAFGFWILDCGHKPNSEIHPPVGVAVHRPRPILIPPGQVFSFNFPDGVVNSTAGNNVYVPGILTDLWFNRNPGEITRNCSDTGLHQPASCNPAYPACAPNCAAFLYGPCIEGKVPMNRIYEFNIYLPRNPAVIARDQGVNAPTPPLYVKISNPWNFGGPSPVVAQVTEGDVTYLHVTLDLRFFGGDTYSRRIEAAWVYPATDNWSLRRWRVAFPTLEVHDDQDPWTDGWNADGDYRFWLTLNNGDQSWTRILYGDDNAHGTMNFSPVWQTGSADPEFWRSLPDTDSSHRLGPDILSYPDQGVQVTSTAYESDSIWDDDPGRGSARLLKEGSITFTSNKGNYSVRVQVQPGTPIGSAVLSSAASRLNNALRVRCNNSPWTPPIRDLSANPFEFAGYLVPGIADVPPLTLESDLPLAQLGTSVAGVGDVNGDGLPDVLIGSPRYGSGSASGGRVQLHYGVPKGLAAAPSWLATDTNMLHEFGASVAPAGDVNKDGFADFIVGSPGFTDGQLNEGAAYVWYGGPTPKAPSAKANWRVQGNFPGAGFGYALASGDVNGDGFSDVIIGAPYYQNSIAAVVPLGRVFIYYGSAEGLETKPSRTLVAPSIPGAQFGNDEWFGFSVAVADLNADGFSDVVVGAPHLSNGFGHEGAIFVYKGSASGVVATPIGRVEGESSGAQFGFAVASAGDVNGDGFSDVIVGAPFFFFDDVTFHEGAASLFLGYAEGLRTTAAWSMSGRWGGARFGTTLAGVGDLNGDGLSDVVVGAPYYGGQINQEGRISVFRGARGRVPLTGPIWVKSSQLPDALFGFAISGAGDMDGDGFDDFLVGAPGLSHPEKSEGAVYLFRGYGTREIRPATSGFFESVDREPNALFNLKEPGYEKLLIEGAKNEPEKFDRMLRALREELQAEVFDTSRKPDAMAALALLKLYVPASLWTKHFGDISTVTAGALYLDCGGTTETIDAVGRRWKPDLPYLVTTNSNQNPFNNQLIDSSLLTDRTIPNNVLLSERWKNGDLRYEIPVENGLHTVILYLSENCPSCVNSNLGGTVACTTCARLFDLEVEGQRVNSYNSADAARPPMGDGFGTTFKATQLVFRDVSVSDKILNVNIIDRGSGNPPENAAIVAMAILQTPVATGNIPPRIKSIVPVELNLAIHLDPGLDYASYLSGLATFDVERSADLKTWSATGTVPFTFRGELIFELAPIGRLNFYRVRLR